MRMIFAAKDESEAAFVVSLLESEGITSQLWSVRGEGGQVPPQIWLLKDADFKAASALIQEYVKKLEAPKAEGEPWTCAGCGENHASTYTDCWKCGRSRQP